MKNILIKTMILSTLLFTGCQNKTETLPSYTIVEEEITTSYAIDVNGYEADASLDEYSKMIAMVSYYFKDNVQIDDTSYKWVASKPETIKENCYYLDVTELVNYDDPKSGLIIGEHTVTVTIANSSGSEESSFKVIVEE